MAVTVLNFEGGTPGATVAADVTSGYTAVLIDGGQTMTYTSSAGEFFNGSRGIKIVATPTSAHAYGQVQGLATTQCAVDVLVKWPSTSTADFQQVRLMTSAGVSIATLLMNSAGKIRLQGNGGVTVFTLTATTPTNAWTRLKLWVKPGASSTTGSATLEVWNADTSTLIQATSSTTSADFGTALIDWVRVGNSGGFTGTYFMDLVAYDPAATGLMADQGGNIAPTVNAGSDQNVAAAASVSLTRTAADSDGTIASTLWTYDYPVSGGPTLTNAGTATVSFTAGSAGALYVLRCVVTDNGGATAFDTVEVRVPTTGELTPLAAYGGTGVSVTNTGGAASEEAALADGTLGSSNNTTYILYPSATGTAVERRWRLKPSTARSSMTVTPTVAVDTAGTFTGKIRVYEGAVQKAEWTLSTPTTSFADQSLTFTPTQAGTVGDWGNLWIAAVEST